MPPITVGHFLVNDVLPHDLHIDGPITNKQLHDRLVGLAKTDPAKYVTAVSALKRRGDEIATLEGITVGLKDITPDYVARDKVINNVVHAMSQEKDKSKHERLIIDAQSKLLDQTKKHPGSMTAMALSGARGNPAQLMKIVSTPLASNIPGRGIDPYLIRRSYSEGLSAAEYWTTAPEARANNVATVVSVSQPGEMAKLLVANMANKVVTRVDCGTTNGLRLSTDDGNALDRYLAAPQAGLPRNTLVTPQLVQTLHKRGVTALMVRSPMTCAANPGVCQMCMGLSEKGKIHGTGTNVGIRAAQAMAEPLTQMALGSKHAVLVIKVKKLEPEGLKGVKQLTDIPKTFLHEAVLAPNDGVVTRVEPAPQGGHFVYVGAQKLYAGPSLTVTAKIGDHVEEGDALTNGVPHPAKVVAAKGLGAGRQYFVDMLHKTYANEGVNIDRRHLELLAKSHLNHVKLTEADDDHPEFLKGDVLDYNAFRDAYAKATTDVAVKGAAGHVLGREAQHYTVGTRLTPNVVRDLQARGVTTVSVLKKAPKVEFIMKPLAMNPMHDHDWMGRLSHRFLGQSIREGAHFGESSDIHGTNPVPAYAYGAELKHRDDGTY